MNGKKISASSDGSTGSDQHASAKFAVPGGTTEIKLAVRNDFGIGFPAELPPLGSASQGLRVLSETWSSGTLELAIAGAAGATYELPVWNASLIASVEGAEFIQGKLGQDKIRVRIPKSEREPYPREKILILFKR